MEKISAYLVILFLVSSFLVMYMNDYQTKIVWSLDSQNVSTQGRCKLASTEIVAATIKNFLLPPLLHQRPLTLDDPHI
ncbi:unnamed protein product [Eruca vesicaria subsp. sativa]|uniref:Uncharacterized protein n=1 Tax=Eruca vesicaria subsp. sativa TaxID=29727 RepID=A0ABC8KCB8_ERUVS|nr:unnamed protein product [Eruca vesicaria subsp. sativa]